MSLSCPHFSISIRQRSKRQSAVAGAAYQSGEKLFSEYDGKMKNYRYKAPEVVYSEILLPPNAPPEYQGRQTLWNAAEGIEKQWNSQLSRGIIMALPNEIPQEQYAGLVRDYCMEQFVAKGMCVDFAIHDKHDGNPHAHIMLTMRSMDEQGRWNPKAHKVYDLDEKGERIVLLSGEYKSHKENVVDWNNQGNAEIWRAAWAAAVNRCYERNNSPVRIDLRSFERQGIEQVPTVHLGPAVSHMEDKGIQTEIGNYNREIKAHNATVKSIKRLIVSLEAWFIGVKEKLAALLAKEEKSPTLMSILNTYGSIRKQERSGWSNSGKQKGAVLDVKFAAKAFSAMNALGICTLDDFGHLIDELRPLLDEITANEKQIRKLNFTVEHIGNIQRYKPIYDQSKKGFDKTKAKYAEAHKTELALFGKAVRYLKANKRGASDLDAYRDQRDELKNRNAEIRSKLLSLNLDAELILEIQQRVDTVLNYAGEAPADEKKSIRDSLREPVPESATSRAGKSKNQERE
ncbi:MAG: MobA/MobL family protein [Clostridiales bacterium]|jgi:hypothetical protein|nr:MobA/MobL family protein [Clostridiales bacterium]